MTDVPQHWVPFIPVRSPSSSRQVGLVEAVLPRPDSFGDLVTASPRSSVLQELQGLVSARRRGALGRRHRATALVPRALGRRRAPRLGRALGDDGPRRGLERTALRRRATGLRVSGDGGR